MIAVIFEVEPHGDRHDDYLAMAGDLKPLLRDVDGFISVERFESLTTPGKLVSLSFWRDEDAVKAWRSVEKHKTAQSAGRTEMFRDYRLRVAHVLRDYGMTRRDEAPEDLKQRHGG